MACQTCIDVRLKNASSEAISQPPREMEAIPKTMRRMMYFRVICFDWC
jgi:hypothetical protein